MGFGVPSQLHAELRLPAIWSDNAALQADQPLPLWGWADPSATVVVQLNAANLSTTADAEGHWRLELPAQPASATPTQLVVRVGRETLTAKNLIIGEVWLCSGQSNMAFRLDQALNARTEIARAKRPTLRLFSVALSASPTPVDDVKGRWVECSPETVGSFTAVGFFFGQRLQNHTTGAVGLIHSSWGGSPAAAWTPHAVLAGDADFRPILERWDSEIAAFPAAKAAFDADQTALMAAYDASLADAYTRGLKEPSAPAVRAGLERSTPGGLYNAMLAPLAPFAIRGILWYQGESNAGRAEQYRRLFPALINAWRQAWHNPELPFLWVQLPNLRRYAEPSSSGWAELREAQALTLDLPRTAMAVTIDLGSQVNLHPIEKQYVGQRLWLAAQGLVYGGDPGSCFSPRYLDHTISGRNVTLRFDTHGGTLAVRDQTDIRGFVICGDDHVWHDARARLAGNTVTVWHEDIPQPIAVRYAWGDDPPANLVSGVGLPVIPFRTDTWPDITTGRR